MHQWYEASALENRSKYSASSFVRYAAPTNLPLRENQARLSLAKKPIKTSLCGTFAFMKSPYPFLPCLHVMAAVGGRGHQPYGLLAHIGILQVSGPFRIYASATAK